MNVGQWHVFDVLLHYNEFSYCEWAKRTPQERNLITITKLSTYTLCVLCAQHVVCCFQELSVMVKIPSLLVPLTPQPSPCVFIMIIICTIRECVENFSLYLLLPTEN